MEDNYESQQLSVNVTGTEHPRGQLQLLLTINILY